MNSIEVLLEEYYKKLNKDNVIGCDCIYKQGKYMSVCSYHMEICNEIKSCRYLTKEQSECLIMDFCNKLCGVQVESH